MNLIEQCNQWNQERQYKKIIDAIEAVPERARTTEQIMELARAYNNYGIESDSSYFIKTIEILKPLTPHLKNSSLFWLRYGFALFHAKYLPGALDCFLYALRLLTKDKKDEALRISILKLARMCLEQIPLLVDNDFETLKTKTENSWKNVSKLGKQIYDTLSAENVDKTRAGMLIHMFSESLAISPALMASFDKDTKRVTMRFLSGGSQETLHELNYFISQRPLDVFPESMWNFTLDSTSVAEPKMRNQVFSIDAANVKVTLSTGSRSTRFADIKLYAPNVTMYLSDPERGPVVVNALKGLVDYSLGEICRMALIDNIEIVRDEQSLTSGNYNKELGVFTLKELYSKLTELGFNTAVTAAEYLDHCFLAYDFEGTQERYQPLRFDVYIGSTSMNETIADYYKYKNSVLARMLIDGILPCFFGFKLSDAVSEDDFADEIFALRERCEQYFGKRKDSLPVLFTGGAQGDRYCYIDMMNFHYTHDFLNAAAEFFLDEDRVAEAFFAPMCTGVRPIVLKGPEELANEFGDGLEKFVLGQHADMDI